jgi:hypothetical protein
VGAELLFDVISTAYEKTSVIVTTKLPFERWTEVLGNERLVGATLDRLTYRCHLLEATGENYRLREARQRQSESPANGRNHRKKTDTGRAFLPPVPRAVVGRDDALLSERLHDGRQARDPPDRHVSGTRRPIPAISQLSSQDGFVSL